MSAMAVDVRPPVWRRLVGFNLLTGVVLGDRRLVRRLVRRRMHIAGPSLDYFGDIDFRTSSRSFSATSSASPASWSGSASSTIRWARLRGYPPSLREKETRGHRRATSGSAPTTRSSASSTCAASGSSSSSAA